MLEFLIALLIFSTGMLGLLSAQLVGKKAGYEALQRSVATALARDILERIRANPGHALDYRIAAAGIVSERIPVPVTDCDRSDCSGAELAAFDLRQWESLLLGASERSAGRNAGGLLSPLACITNEGGVVEVEVSWKSIMPLGQATDSICEIDVDGIPVADDQAASDMRQRSHLRIATFVAS